LDQLDPLITGTLRPIVLPDKDERLVLTATYRACGALQLEQMSTPTEFFCWWIIDEPTGERRLTRFKLSRAHAQRAFPGAEPALETREVRELPDEGQPPPGSRPGGDWR
jgi:hypothetical protein